MKIRKILCFVLIFALLLPSAAFFASAQETLDEKRRRYEDIEEQIRRDEKALQGIRSDKKSKEKRLKSLSGQIEGIEEQINLLGESISALNGDIGALGADIEKTNSDIDKTAEKIGETENQIAETEAFMRKTRETTLARIRENYMSGTGSNLEFLLTSKDLPSFFARKELVAEVSERDAKTMRELTEKISVFKDLQTELEASKAVFEAKKEVLSSQKTSLNAKRADLEQNVSAQENKKKTATGKYKEIMVVVSELDKNGDAYKAAIKKKEAEREALEAEIDGYIKQHGSSKGDVPDESYKNDGKMAWPVKGKTRITAGYPTYPSGGAHWGIDIVKADGKTKGEPFYAAQGGEVILAINDGNWNQGFGNYCIIDHGDGTQTLYAHSDNILVHKGQKVKKGEKIGLIGDTGNVTGPHLHFEVRVKHKDGSVSRENPLDYVTQPS